MVDDVFDEVGLKVENLHASYGAVEVLRGLDFEVEAKGVSVILGANGAGKTTTLRAICNMCTTSGTVTLGDEDITRTGTAEIVRKGVAHVPQGRGTFPELSTMDNLMVGAYTRKDNEVKDDLDRWFEIFPRLSERRDQLAGSLSGGEQQRVAIGRAIAKGPDLLLADEPTGNLDPHTADEVFDVLLRLARGANLAAVIATHNPGLASRMDRIARLEDGHLIET